MRPNEPDGLDRTVGEEEVVVGGGHAGNYGTRKDYNYHSNGCTLSHTVFNTK